MSGAADCAFCEVVAGRRPADAVLEDARLIGFLDARPLFKGHVLLVPRGHVASLAEADAATLGALFAAARRVALALERGLGAEGALVAVNHRVSQSVPHLHVHVIPRRKGDGLRGFFWPRVRYDSDEERERVRARLAEALNDMSHGDETLDRSDRGD